MKRIISIVLVLAISLSSLALVSCGSSDDTVLEKYEKLITKESKKVKHLELNISEDIYSSSLHTPSLTEDDEKISTFIELLQKYNLTFKETSKAALPITDVVTYYNYTLSIVFSNGDYELNISITPDGYVYLLERDAGNDDTLSASYVSTTQVSNIEFIAFYHNLSGFSVPSL